ncbi:MAG: translation initiation factor IF-2 [Candidatus Gracilibacteria bacterium]|nr:translation initiation factor IF-2 [Candidatus Gracilibacteria bacterium]
MAVKLVDLADKLGVKVADVRDYIDFLDLDVPKSAQEISEENAAFLEEEILKDVGEESAEETEDIDENEDIAAEEVEVDEDGNVQENPDKIAISEESTTKIEEFEDDFEEKLQREIKQAQRKSTAGKKDASKKLKKKKKDEADEGTVKDTGVQEAVLRTKDGFLELPDVISVNDLAQRTGIPVARIIGELMKNGILATINQQIDYETAHIITQDFGVKVKRKREEASIEEMMEGDLESLLKEDDPGQLEERPPVVVIMGHVDHGKTQILDRIRNADVVAGESGGITQHIGAYQIGHKEKKITFLDTPGHASFSAMRARGARVTDVAILVVAADEGVKEQTVEAYHHAKEAEVPLIVALNKIDKENADPERVKGELGQKLGIELEEWGGNVPVVETSAIRGDGIDDLLDTILVLAEMQELKANPNREAIGTVIESHLDKSLGPIATIVVNTGTLQVMDNVVIGQSFGRLKRMMDHRGKKLRAVGPAGPVQIAGLSEVPLAGDVLIAVKDEKTARDRAIKIATKRKMIAHANSFVELLSRIKEGRLKSLKMIVKADTKGSLEAIKASLAKMTSDEVKAQVIHSGIGNVSLNDVNMAATSMAVIFGFHVDTPPQVARQAEQIGVEIRHTKIIYKLLEDVRLILEGLLDPEIIEVELGIAKVLEVFHSKKKEMIIGCKVTKGSFKNRVLLRVIRGDKLVGEGKITSLQKGTDKAEEVKEGHECGVKYEGKFKVESGDILEAYVIEKRKRTL